MSTYRIRVGWTSQRPVIPDQHVSEADVIAPDGFAGAALARVIAAQLVGTSQPWQRPAVMVTSTKIINQEI